MYIGYTLEEYYDRELNSDFNSFLNKSLYKVDEHGQLSMIFIDDVDDLTAYFDYIITYVDKVVIICEESSQ